MIIFGVMAYKYYEEKKNVLAITFGALALLFQPFIKVALGRTMWNVVDVAVAIGLIVLFIIEKDKGKYIKRTSKWNLLRRGITLLWQR